MPERRDGREPVAALSGKERGAIEELLAYVEECVRDHEPVCAKLVEMARLALRDPEILEDPSRVLH